MQKSIYFNRTYIPQPLFLFHQMFHIFSLLHSPNTMIHGVLSRTNGRSVKEWNNNRVILQNDVLNYLREQIVLNSDRKTRKKAPVDCQECQSRERLVE